MSSHVAMALVDSWSAPLAGRKESCCWTWIFVEPPHLEFDCSSEHGCWIWSLCLWCCLFEFGLRTFLFRRFSLSGQEMAVFVGSTIGAEQEKAEQYGNDLKIDLC